MSKTYLRFVVTSPSLPTGIATGLFFDRIQASPIQIEFFLSRHAILKLIPK
jgi:hypothetical protein